MMQEVFFVFSLFKIKILFCLTYLKAMQICFIINLIIFNIFISFIFYCILYLSCNYLALTSLIITWRQSLIKNYIYYFDLEKVSTIFMCQRLGQKPQQSSSIILKIIRKLK